MGERKGTMESVGGLILNIKHKPEKKMWEELCIVATVIFAFMTAACINKWKIMGSHMAAYLITLFADIVLAGGWSWKICNAALRQKKAENERGKDTIGIAVILAYCTLVRIVQLKDMPRWDALQYYNMLRNACRNFDFSITSFLDNFIFAAHPTLGFAGVTAIGEFLMPDKYQGVLVVWLVVTGVAAICAYRIFQKILFKCSRVYHVAATCVLMTTPIVLGTFSYYQPDMGLICFFLFLLYSYLYRKNLLMFFSIVLILMTKEIGIVALAGFGIGLLLGRILFREKKESVKNALCCFFKEPLGISGIIAFVLLVAYFLMFIFRGGSIWNYGDAGFRLESGFIWHKCKQYFVLNFAWIIWGGNLILGLLKFPVLRKRVGCLVAYKDIVLSILFTAAAQMLFLSVYFTFAFPRYQELIDLCGVLLFLIQVGGFSFMGEDSEKNFERYNLKKVLCIVVLGGTFFIESYVTIDPLSLLTFKNKNTGKMPMIMEDYNRNILQADFSVYNHQHNYFTALYNHILAEVAYHEGMDLIVWSNPGSYEILEDTYYWDIKKRQITLHSEGNTLIKGYVQEQINDVPIVFQKEAVFIGIPQLGIEEESAEKFLTKHYEIRYKGNVSVGMAGEAFFYVCDLIK